MMRRVLATVALVFAMVVTQLTPAHALTGVDLVIDVGSIPQGTAGKPVSVSIPLLNAGDTDAQGVVVIPQLSTSSASFPFEITSQSYATTVGEITAGERVEVDLGELTLRADLATGYYALPLKIQHVVGDERQVIDKAVFIKVEGVPTPAPSAPAPVTTVPPQTVEIVVTRDEQPQSFDTSSLSGLGGAADTGTGLSTTTASAASGSVPRVMLTSFSTDPTDVLAGSDFTLSLGLSNMSSATSIGNLKITVVSAESALLPVSGASSAYIASIPAGGGAGVSFTYKALPTLEERPYQLTIHLEYENNADHAPVVADESIAIVVSQPSRAETSQLKLTPSAITVDQDANVSFTVQNLGKSVLHNTKVKLKDNPALSAEEVFVGNIAPGSAGAVDVMMTALEAGVTKAVLEISYEDAAGKRSSFERTVDLDIAESAADDPMVETTDSGAGASRVLVPLLALIALGLVVGGYVWNQRRKQRRAAELAESMSHLDAEPIVPPDVQ